MTILQPRYSKEEYARRGTEIYERDILPVVGAENRGRIVAIDIESGAYELADDTLNASDQLFARVPDAQIWFVRIGYPAVHRIGPHTRIAMK
jgi:hypothetical protein